MKHSNPPQKVHVVSRGEVQRSLLVALVSLGTVIVLSLFLLFASNFVGKAITPAVAGNVVQLSFDPIEKDVILTFSVNKEVNGVYFELHGVDLDLCDTTADITVVENPFNPSYPLWQRFTETACDNGANIFKVSKATINPDAFIKPSAGGRLATLIVKLHLRKFIPSSFSLQLQNVHMMAIASDASGNFNLFNAATTETYLFTNPASGTARTQVTVGRPGAPLPTSPVPTQLPTAQPIGTPAAGTIPSSVTTQPQIITQQPSLALPQNQTNITTENSSRAREGRGYGCVPEWQCGQWGFCNATLQQGRGCTDVKRCSSKPRLEARACAACQESWICSAWSTCSNGFQTRICTDEHQCKTARTKPPERQSCIEERGYTPQPAVQQQNYQPLVQPPVRPLISSPAKKSFIDLLVEYKWFIIVPLVLLLLVVMILLFLRSSHEPKQPEGFNYDELNAWVQQGLRAGVTPEQLWQRLQQETEWKKEEFERVMNWDTTDSK